MTMSTQTLGEASRMLAAAVLTDSIQISDVGVPVTEGFEVVRHLTAVGDPVPALVQTTTLANAAESRVESLYSVKVSQGTPLSAGQAVTVLRCSQEPSLVGKKLLMDKVSQNGAAVIRKGVATDFAVVNQEGKEGI